jgi:hypothetical protein
MKNAENAVYQELRGTRKHTNLKITEKHGLRGKDLSLTAPQGKIRNKGERANTDADSFCR